MDQSAPPSAPEAIIAAAVAELLSPDTSAERRRDADLYLQSLGAADLGASGAAVWTALLGLALGGAALGAATARFPHAAPAVRQFAGRLLRGKCAAAAAGGAEALADGPARERAAAIIGSLCGALAAARGDAALLAQLSLAYAALSSVVDPSSAAAVQRLEGLRDGERAVALRLLAEYGIPELHDDDPAADAEADAAAGFISAAGSSRSAWLQHGALQALRSLHRSGPLSCLCAAPGALQHPESAAGWSEGAGGPAAIVADVLRCFCAWLPWVLPQSEAAASPVMAMAAALLLGEGSPELQSAVGQDGAVCAAAAAVVCRAARLSSATRGCSPVLRGHVMQLADRLSAALTLDALADPDWRTPHRCEAAAACAVAQLPTLLEWVGGACSEQGARARAVFSAMSAALRLPPLSCGVAVFPFWRRLGAVLQRSGCQQQRAALARALCGASEAVIGLAGSAAAGAATDAELAALIDPPEQPASDDCAGRAPRELCSPELGEAMRAVAGSVGARHAYAGALGSLQEAAAGGFSAALGHLLFLHAAGSLGGCFADGADWGAAAAVALSLNAKLPADWRVRAAYARWLGQLAAQARGPHAAAGCEHIARLLTAQADAARAHTAVRVAAAFALTEVPPEALATCSGLADLHRAGARAELPLAARAAVAAAVGRAAAVSPAHAKAVLGQVLEHLAAAAALPHPAAAAELRAASVLWIALCGARPAWLGQPAPSGQCLGELLAAEFALPVARPHLCPYSPPGAEWCMRMLGAACSAIRPMSAAFCQEVALLLAPAPAGADSIAAAAAFAEAASAARDPRWQEAAAEQLRRLCSEALGRAAALHLLHEPEMWRAVFAAAASPGGSAALGPDRLAAVCGAALQVLRSGEPGSLPERSSCQRAAADLLCRAATSWLQGDRAQQQLGPHIADALVAAATAQRPLPRGAGLCGLALALLQAPGNTSAAAAEWIGAALHAAAASGRAPRHSALACSEAVWAAARDPSPGNETALRRALVTLHSACQG
eukprot:TRINITY_DN8772_c0_g1_i1.p1 TRINITY_DN8772_c0_g1~~TRINITY_DN8772_c0_g1_i1.p1  ORF type:complete len:1012 (+),score=322.88 TRINITY_DN8772_c0_g1_i1:180-3215(+)